MEDILEELVGEIQDEYDAESDDVHQVDEHTYVVNASLSVADVNDRVAEFELPEGSDYTSVSGLINKWLGRIPEVNETFEYDSVRMTVLETDNHHVVQVKIEKLADVKPPRTPAIPEEQS